MTWLVFEIAWLLLAVSVAIHAIMYKRDHKGAALWIFLAFSFPIIGAWFYWVFGINRIERRATKRLGGRERPFALPTTIGDFAVQKSNRESIGHLVSLASITDRITKMPLLAGNAVTPLHNGERAYPAMLEAIASAQTSVTLASYIFDWDEVGRKFADALAEAAGRGVKVHVLVDGIGALTNFSRMGRRLLKSNVEVEAFAPLRFPFGRLRFNLRNHRKILVVDGQIGFTGGMNISHKHLLEQPTEDRVEDLHFEMRGPVVAQLQQAFVDDWYLACERMLEGDAYFPELPRAGEALCRGISSGPDETLDNIHWAILAALAAAQKEVVLVTPYFVPTESLVSAMSMAALRGVDVKIILPSHVDHPFMRWAADAYLWQVLEHGVRVFHRPPPFVHTKLMVVDHTWVLVGSSNLDPRSFRLNFEFNVEIYDNTLATQLAIWLAEVFRNSEELSLARVDRRPRLHRFRDGFVRLFSSWL